MYKRLVLSSQPITLLWKFKSRLVTIKIRISWAVTMPWLTALNLIRCEILPRRGNYLLLKFQRLTQLHLLVWLINRVIKINHQPTSPLTICSLTRQQEQSITASQTKQVGSKWFHLHVAAALEKTRKHDPVPLQIRLFFHSPCSLSRTEQTHVC